MVILKMNRFHRVAKWIAIVSAVAIMAVSFSGCKGKAKSKNPYRSMANAVIPTQNLASNSDYKLDWDNDARAVFLKSISDDGYWSDILYERFLEGSESANGNSPISITVANTKTLQWDTFTSFEQLENGATVACKKIKNGIRVTYFFERYKIAVPVEYTLREDSLNVAIDGNTILEDGTDYKLVSVTLTPNFCSIKNDVPDGYVFVPSGCGALMYAKETSDGVRKYSGEVYGEDAARQTPTDFVDDEAVRLPVFGVSGGGRALLGIIEEGAGAAVIDAQAGNERLGYSNVGATFYVRGYDKFFFTYHGKPQGTTRRINDNISPVRMSVGYYPLTGEDAGYAGMAKRYREYLFSHNSLSKSKTEQTSYSVSFLGGTGITKSVLGIPKKEIVSLTTFSQADEIVSKMSEEGLETPVVRLVGFGDNGVRPGSIAGGKGLLSVYGSQSELASLLKKYPKTFLDYDIVRFSKSGNGFSLSDTAKTAIQYKAEHFAVTPTRVMDEENPYYIISRQKLESAADAAIKKAEKYQNRQISLSTLGTTSFSDYASDDYINKNKIEDDVATILKKVKGAADRIAVSGANAYAATTADVIFDTASTAGNYSAFDAEIPFYQMVFHSYKTMYSEAVNVCENADAAVARSMAYGMGASFLITADYVKDSDDLGEYPLYATVFDDNREIIKKAMLSSGFSEIYKETADAAFVAYQLPENGVSVSVYENGIKIYVNHTNSEKDSPAGKLAAYSFLAVREG